jgi:hypothetical protein
MKSLSQDELERHNNSTHCHICKELICSEDELKVFDHDHITGKYRGPAHVVCNINYQVKKELPIFVHNLKGFDANLILKQLSADEFKQCQLIPQTTQKFLSFSLYNSTDKYTGGKIKFLDSFNFMSSALSTLVNNLAKSGPDEFKVTRQAFFKKYPNLVNENNFELLLRKSIFPYEYITNFDVFNDAKLPSKNHFYSSLTFDTVSNDDYNYAQKVWKEFDCKTLGDYHDIYLELDVCLLADVFTKFRKTIYENYQLEAAHFYSVPGLSFSACLKTTKVELELLTDPEMVLLFESGLRGGVTQCSKRYAKANNKYLENYDENDKNSYLLYVDCNSLYGYSMADYMPESEFKWLNDEEIKNFERNIDMYLNSTDVGYVIECNLEYPERLHDFQ